MSLLGVRVIKQCFFSPSLITSDELDLAVMIHALDGLAVSNFSLTNAGWLDKLHTRRFGETLKTETTAVLMSTGLF